MTLHFKKIHLLGLSILSGILMGLAWPTDGFGPLVWVGLIPMLTLEAYIVQNKNFFSRGAVALYSLPGFLMWNIWTTWWVWYASPAAIAAFVLNSFFMAFAFGLGSLMRRKLFNSTFGYIAIIITWISFEWGHQEWDLTWSWLNLGNAYASSVQLVQWYEYTGVFGGTLWTWLVNIFLFLIVWDVLQKKPFRTLLVAKVLPAILVLLVPISISLIQYTTYVEQGKDVEVIAIQQNLDPYSLQYTTPQDQVIHKVLNLTRSLVTDETDLVIAPESTLQGRLWEADLDEHLFSDSIRNFLVDYPKLSMVIGASTRRMLVEGEQPEPEARIYWRDSTKMYYSYNTAIRYAGDMPIEVYHKSKMVPGVERMPFKKFLGFIDKIAIDLGGTTGSLGLDKERKSFKSLSDDVSFAPVICYESIYSRFVSDFMTDSANLISIITNDGWWENTPGHRQHFEYARLRAIENRTSVARSANTGISGFINQRGDVLQKTNYWEEDVVKATVKANTGRSFYAKYKDYIANLSMFFTALLLLAFLSLFLRKKEA